MAKILVLAASGFGKSSSIAKIDEFGHIGLDPKETYMITATSKPLPFKGQSSLYKITTIDKLNEGNRVITNNGSDIGRIIRGLSKSPYKNIVLDDSNYIMQDYYMENSLKKGYDTFKEIGKFMDDVFSAAESLRPDQNFIMMAHFEEFKDSSSDTLSYRFKTVGKMVECYLVPLSI